MSAAAPLLWHLLDPIAPVLLDPLTEELCINRPGEMFVRQRGVFARQEMPLNLGDLLDVAILAGALRRQDISEETPLIGTDVEAADGSLLRFQVVQPPAVPGGTVSITIRRPGSNVHDIASTASRYQQHRWNRWDRRREQKDQSALLALYDAGDLVAFLNAAVASRLNILLCGATGSGKTTMSKTLISAIPPDERLITIEDAMELVLRHPNSVRLLYSKGGQGSSNVTAKSLLEASLRMRPDRVLVQELRDSEAAWTYLNEVVSGHPGSITTIHGRDAAGGFKKLFALAKGSKEGGTIETPTLVDLLAAGIDLIMPFESHGTTFEIGEMWFAADAARRGETAASLLSDH